MPESLPVAVAIALSPFPVIPAILLLFTASPRAAGGAFLGGWAAGVAAATTVAVLLADVVSLAGTTPRWVSWTRVVLGVLLVLYGLRQWMARGSKDLPGWMLALKEATPRRAYSLGLLLSVANPKIVLLAVAGGMTIGAEEVGARAEIAAIVLFTAVASVTVAAPLVAYVIGGQRVLGPLRRVNDWLERHHDAVLAVVLVVIGILLLVKGVQDL